MSKSLAMSISSTWCFCRGTAGQTGRRRGKGERTKQEKEEEDEKNEEEEEKNEEGLVTEEGEEEERDDEKRRRRRRMGEVGGEGEGG